MASPTNRLKRELNKDNEIANLSNRLRFTEEVLARYKQQVESTLQPQLEAYAATCDDLGSDVERLRVENAKLNENLQVALTESAGLVTRQMEMESKAARERTALLDAHQDHLRSVRHDHSTKEAALEAQIAALKTDVQRFTNSEQRNAEATTQKRADDLQQLLHHRDAEIRRLRLMLAEREKALDESNSLAVDQTELSLSVDSAMNELKACAEESIQFARILTNVCEQSGIGSAKFVECWEPFANLSTVGASIKERSASLHVLCKKMRATTRHEKGVLGESLRAILLKHNELLDVIATKENEHHTSIELSNRRLAELEDDRRAEREMLELRLEKERVRQTLESPSNVGGVRGLGSAMLRAPVKTSSAGCQTGIELLIMSQESNDENIRRVQREMLDQQEELSRKQDVIVAMERQRQRFMFFVDDEDIASDVRDVLGRSQASFVRH